MNSFETDPVEEAMRRLYRATTASVVAPEVEAIVGRARAHRRNNAVLAGAAVIATVVVGVLLTGPLRGPQSLPIPPASPSDGPTGSPTPSVSATPADGRVLPEPAPALALPQSPLLRPSPAEHWRSGVHCAPEAMDSFSITRAVGDPQAPLGLHLSMYPTEDSARAAFASVRQDPAPCSGLGGEGRVPAVEAIGDEGVWVEFPKEADGAGEMAGMPVRVLAFRVDAVVVVLTSGPAYAPDYTGLVQAATRSTMRAVAQDLVENLTICSAACPRAAELPEALPELVEGGRAWLVAVHAFPEGQSFEAELRAALRLGYQPTVVRRGCDEGVEFLAGTVQTTRYLAIYFTTEAEATIVRNALVALDAADVYGFPRALEVTTRCVT